MSVAEFVNALIYPLRSSVTLVALVSFYLLLQLAIAAGIFGVWLAVIIVPALFRYLVMLAEARAQNRDAEPPGIEYFSFAGNLWTLFPVLPLVAFLALYLAAADIGAVPAVMVAGLIAALFPAMMAVLVITHSPAQSLNPVAWFQLTTRLGVAYLYAPVMLVLIVILLMLLQSTPHWMQSLVELYAAFAFYSVVGTMLARDELLDEVAIPDVDTTSEELQQARLFERRATVLNHAYGFVSRGNSDGGLQHIFSWLESDPQPAAAWPWFFEQMLRWDTTDAALAFAQVWVGELLRNGLNIQAVKIMLRARLVNERFRPRPEDLPLAIDAAEKSGNEELLAALRQYA